MAHNQSSKGLVNSKTYSTLTLNGGYDCRGFNWALPVDLKVKGGLYIQGRLCNSGNIVVENNIVVNSNLYASNIIAGNLGPRINSFDVDGKIFFLSSICGNVIANNLSIASNLSQTGSFEHYGLLGNCIVDNVDGESQVCANDDNTVTIDVNADRHLIIHDSGSIQYNELNLNHENLGNLSHSQGYRSLASGDYSFASGENTIASGFASHSEGIETQAIGDFSHSEGCGTIASGFASHAENLNTTASGRSSHSEGIGTIVSGNVSHGEGYYNTVASDFSHVEGQFNVSTSYLGMDHIEGRNNISTDGGGLDSGLNHIEGECNFVTGYCCHVEGASHEVSGKYCHVGGLEAKADQYGMWARSGGKIETVGDAQTSILQGCMKIVGNLSSTFTLNYPESPNIFPVIPTDQCWMFDLYITGKDINTIDYYGEKYEMMISNNADVLTVMSNSIAKLTSGTVANSMVSFTSSGNIFNINVNSSSGNISHWAFTMFNTQVF